MANELVAYNGADSIRLMDSECTNETVLKHLEPDTRPEFRAAAAMLQGKSFTACWRAIPSAAHLVYEDGDQGIIPVSTLKQTVGI
ncbi:MAG: hypothetical protein V4757_15040 [Pseudomonadota bacterium]